MFNNCDVHTNGEMLLWNTLKSKVSIVFDVGTQADTYYIDESPENITFHLFEPNVAYYEKIHKKVGHLSNVIVNNCGLGNINGTLNYYIGSESFVNRWNESVHAVLDVRILSDYVNTNDVKSIDFMKIDTEGFEIDVLQGAGSFLKNITHIQFEYGGTYPDRGVTLTDVYNILRPYGFEFYILTGNGLYPTPEPMEHGQYSNYLATRCKYEVQDIIIPG
jgi:FkbM family methyltransferase